jgi:tRNA modification GTPase
VTDTIVAQATPPGRGGVAIVRVSGPLVYEVIEQVLKTNITARHASYLPFYFHDNTIIDEGIALFFPNPHSFTGEHVLELQGHGGPVIMDMLIESILTVKGTRLARPGEFSEQAFLNDKLDLTQAEAIADLIEASSRSAARSALHSLQGVFSTQVNVLAEQIVHLRMYVEAAIDFPEEEIDFLSDGKVAKDLSRLNGTLDDLISTAKQGSLLREGLNVVIAGKPNAGKSSLLNQLAGKDSAIVTDIAGTTRDTLKEHISIKGVPLHITDTAGLRDSTDKVEQIGIERAWQAINTADRILFMVDATQSNEEDPFKLWPEFMDKLPVNIPLTVIRNKIDKTNEQHGLSKVKTEHGEFDVVRISAQTQQGIAVLQDHLASSMGIVQSTEGQFIARRRHLDALAKTKEHLRQGTEQLHNALAGELLAEELRLAHQYLCEITGEFTSNDLLGKIFSSFCIGK